MLNFNAERFVRISVFLEKMNGILKEPRIGDYANLLKHTLDELHPLLMEMRLSLSAKKAHLMSIHLALPELSNSVADMKSELDELHSRIVDELEGRLFFQVSPDKAKFYNNPREEFGEEAINKFPSIIFDVEEAGKCYALGRNTATVFHLMKIMEICLRVLGKALGVPDNLPTWDAILGKCDEEMAKRREKRTSEWLANEAQFSEACVHLRSVKFAWRNKVMHIEKSYSDEQAKDIFSAVSGFTAYLATFLVEERSAI